MANGVYWIGADGKVYVKGDQGTNAAGVADNNTNNYWTSRGFDRIPDPSPPINGWQGDGLSQTSAPASGGGSSNTDAKRVLNDAAVANTRKAIGSLDTEFDTGVRNINDSYGSLIGKYDKEKARTTQDYDEQGVENNQSLLKNKQNALLAAAQGRRGLRGTLASIGALSGDGSVLADRAVTTGANQDIGEATDTFATNSQTLDKALGRFNEEDEDRRKEAETTKANQRTALEGTIAGKRQSFYEKMAELFADAENTGEATDWLNKAGDLNSVIAAKSRVAATPFTAKTAAFTPGDLESYLAGAGDMTVDVTSGGVGGRGPSSIFAGRGLRKRRDEEEAFA